jgi:DNA-binding HxlR family transcriptional regulator
MENFIYDKRIYYHPIEFAIFHIGGTWKIPILLALRNGPQRYGELKTAISHITDKMLVTQLRELEKKKMIYRSVYRQKPPKVTYTLTVHSEKAFAAIDALTIFGNYMMNITEVMKRAS